MMLMIFLLSSFYSLFRSCCRHRRDSPGFCLPVSRQVHYSAILEASFFSVASGNTTGDTVNSFKPHGSTAFTSSLCLLRNITSLFTVFNNLGNLLFAQKLTKPNGSNGFWHSSDTAAPMWSVGLPANLGKQDDR